MILYRPVGMQELALIYDSDFREFPPRLPEQPIFYPVLNFDYAVQIARDWNTQSNSFAGYVTKFEIDDIYAESLERHVVGGQEHEEFWVPAESLSEFNRHIVGKIAVVEAYFGAKFIGFVPENFGLKNKTATEQARILLGMFDYNPVDFICEVQANAKTIFLNFRYWQQTDAQSLNLTISDKERVLVLVKTLWADIKNEIALI